MSKERKTRPNTSKHTEEKTMNFKKTSAALMAAAVLAVAAPMTAAMTETTVYAASDEAVIQDGVLISIPKNLTEFVIPEGVTEIGYNALYDSQYSLTSLTIPSSVTEVDYVTFYLCKKLTAINVAENNPNYCSIDGILCEKNSENLSLVYYPEGKEGNVVIPNNVTKFSKGAFVTNTKITSMVIPNGVTEIGASAFSGCTFLTSITIPSSVTTIGEGAFYNCSSLTDVTIPSGVTKINSDTFIGCESLNSVTIPSSVTEIAEFAFAYESGEAVEGFEGTINGVAGSAAETYAKTYNLKFNAISESGNAEPTTPSEPTVPTKEQSFRDDKTNITVDGKFPEGTSLKTEVKQTSDTRVSWDITPVDANGNKVQPEGNATVKLPLPETFNKTVYVYRVENGKYTALESAVEGDYIVFKTNHFSEYVLTTEKVEEKPSDNPNTGVSAAAAFGVVALAGAFVIVSKKKR